MLCSAICSAPARQEAKLKGEIDKIKNDRKKLAQALLDAAARIRTVETRLSVAENRLPELDKREAKIKSSLESRRAVLVRFWRRCKRSAAARRRR